MSAMRIRKIIISFMLLGISAMAYSQDKDFGLWYELNAEKAVTKKFDVSSTAMVRTFSNASKIEQAFLEIGASYGFNKYLSATASYRIIDFLEDDDQFHLRHKWFADVKGSLPVNNFLFSVRMRLQIQSKSYLEHASDKNPEYDGRIKFRALYKIPKFPVDPYASIETFSPMFRTSDLFVDKARYALGLQYKINKKNIIEGEYIFQRDFAPHIKDMNIISVSYTLKF
jgi:hypothetical protein